MCSTKPANYVLYVQDVNSHLKIVSIFNIVAPADTSCQYKKLLPKFLLKVNFYSSRVLLLSRVSILPKFLLIKRIYFTGINIT